MKSHWPLIIAVFAGLARADGLQVAPEYPPHIPIVLEKPEYNPPILQPGVEAEVDVAWKFDDGAKFLPGPGDTIHVWATPGAHVVEAIVVATLFKQEDVLGPDMKAKTIKVFVGTDIVRWEKSFVVSGRAPNPPPPVPPEPEPEPEPDVDPDYPFQGMAVLVVDDASKRMHLTATQQRIWTSSKLFDWLDEHTAVDGTGHAYRFWDTGQSAQNAHEFWRNGIRANRPSLPWYHVTNGKKSAEGPLPGSVDEFINVLEAFRK